MIVTNNKKNFELLKIMRAHGWDRDMDIDYYSDLRKKYNVGDFNTITLGASNFNLETAINNLQNSVTAMSRGTINLSYRFDKTNFRI